MPVHICSLGNERDGPHSPKFVSTRDASDILRFISKWDAAGRGMFFCVGTLKPGAKRLKESVAEIAFLHCDIDFKDIVDQPADVTRKLGALRLPPSITVASGNGVHAYWLLTEALPASEMERIEATLRLLADTVGGDVSVCEIARLMRLPGTHNTKAGQFLPVTIAKIGETRYELDDIEEWLAETSPVILRKVRPASQRAEGDDNPFTRAAALLGFKPSVDVEKRLNAMSYMGGGEAAIHATQLAVSASLLNSGMSVAEVVATLISATKTAAGEYGQRWNWKREERALEKMCATWVSKHPQTRALSAAASRQDEATLASARQREMAINGAGGAASAAVVSLADARAAKTKPKKRQADAGASTVVADGVIEAIRRAGQDILLSEGEVWLYDSGIWHVMTPADQQWIMTLIQEGFEALNEPLKTTNLNAAYKRLCEHPGLYRREVPWASGDFIVCQNGVLRLSDNTFSHHAPQHYARRKIGAEYRAGETAPKFVRLLDSMFADRLPEDAKAFIQVIKEWSGAALAISHLSREERKALLLVGPSRTGKTELSRVLRLLIGEPIATPSVAEISERFGLSSLFEAAAWIRDDAINEGDDLDPQRFKTIVTGEPIDIERKHRPAVPGVELALPVLLTTNSLPKARDRSDAIFNRSLILEMTNEVSEEQAPRLRREMGVPSGATTIGQHIFLTEGAGILNWSLQGLRSLLERGTYDVPEVVRFAIQRFKDDNNPVGEWARTALARTPHGRVSRSDLMCAYHGWQREQDGDEARAFGARAFFPRLRSAAPWSADMQEHNGKRFVTGLQLTDEGLQLWDSHSQGPQLKGGSKGSSLTKFDVNKVVQPPSEVGIPTSENDTKGRGDEPRF